LAPTHSQTATPTKKISSDALVTKTPPGSPQVSAAPSIEAASRPHTFKAGTGFYLALECILDSVIKSVAYLPKYNLYVAAAASKAYGRPLPSLLWRFLVCCRLAIGDQHGYLTIVDTRTASRVLGSAVAKQPEVHSRPAGFAHVGSLS
jgi:hypothetical protein